MRITKEWRVCRCGMPVTDREIPLEPGEVFNEVVITDVIITPPTTGPQVDTEIDHRCGVPFTQPR